MKKKARASSAFLNLRTLLGLVLCLFGLVLSLFAAGVLPTRRLEVSKTGATQIPGATAEFVRTPNGPAYIHRDFQEQALTRSGSFNGDLRTLPFVLPTPAERRELEPPTPNPKMFVPPGDTTNTGPIKKPKGAHSTATAGKISPGTALPAPAAPAPAPSNQFDGLDFASWGAGHPPDPNGDVGPTYYIQTINTSIGIYQKSNGNRVAAFTFNTFFNGHFGGNLCETNNFGDPIVVYDSFEDRWIVSDFAFTVDGSGTVNSNVYQCFGVSQSGDPVNGGWYYYYTVTTDNFPDYPKFGVWPDGLYESANLFGPGVGGVSYQYARVWAFNKAQMYAGAPTVQVVSFNVADTGEFTLLPSNARLQTGTPPAGTPNYFVSTWEYLNGQEVYKFHVDWNNISLTTFTGPFVPLASTSWPNATPPLAATPQNSLDPIYIRNMYSTRYTNIGGVESLWASHTVERASGGYDAPRWYQIPVTGGTVGTNDTQAATWDPDGANVYYRYVPSVAVDRMGDMAMGYSLSNSTTNPSIRYAGRLAGDMLSTLSQTEQTLINGTGSQSGSCGGSTCTRWGDYTAMTIDTDGCTFWMTNEYYNVNGLNFLTRIGAFSFPQCTPAGPGGTVSGTVTDANTSDPISGATVMLSSGRSATTDMNGNYSFTNIPAGTYPGMSATDPGYNAGSVSSTVVNDNATTTQNFALTSAPASGCPSDASQSAFQMGVPINVDLTANPGQVILASSASLDQSNTSISLRGIGISTTTWLAQTFTPGVTGQLTQADMNIFCSGCTGTAPNLTLSVRATSGGAPSGADLASGTIAGNSSGSGGYYAATFASPPTLNTGTVYALVVRPTANPSAGTYAVTRSASDAYGSGNAYGSMSSGADGSWSTIGSNRDFGFHTYMKSGYDSSGDLISSAKDANPAAGWLPTWGTLSWTASTPASTNLQFQAAGSNSPAGVFDYVGPDGTAGTFFSNGASLSQFNGMRYIRYKAILSTSNSSVTPALTNATVCYQDLAPAPVLQSVVSRMTQGSSGTFDLALSTNSRVVEPRSDGTGNYTIVFNFDQPVNTGTASVSAGTGSVNNVSFSGNSMIVSLTGVTDQQTVTLSTNGVAGNQTQSAGPNVQIGFLIGDATEDGYVNVGDTIVVRNHSGVTLDNTNFQYDVNADGLVNVGDTIVARNNSGNYLP